MTAEPLPGASSANLDEARRMRLAMLSLVEDQNRSLKALEEAQARIESILASVDQVVWSVDAKTRQVLYANRAAEDIFGRPLKELMADPKAWFGAIHPEDYGIAQAAGQQVRNEGSARSEFRIVRPDGEVRWIRVDSTLVRDAQGNPARMEGIVSDVTDRRRAALALAESEALFRSIVEQSIAGLYILQDGRLAYVNPRFAEILGYDSPDELVGRQVSEFVSPEAGKTVAELVEALVSGKVPSASYTLTAKRKDGTAVEVGANGGAAMFRGRPAVIGLMQDISEKKRAEAEIQRYIGQLQTAFMRTVEVATTISEMRDPYTAGHEKRVAEIAVAIGRELGLDEQRLEGLRVAGYLHDIGKITIPTEILAKPGRLTAAEFALIKGHAEASYEVLKDVGFPWPVAQVARQHHERIDGSGYPQGLKGDQILLEARILAVADVVEAMASHRPYRPGLGIDRALAEIERGRGTAYDAPAADACLRLFRDKGFTMPE